MERERSDADLNPTPRWVKVFAILAGLIAVAFVILHLAGGGPGRHMAP